MLLLLLLLQLLLLLLLLLLLPSSGSFCLPLPRAFAAPWFPVHGSMASRVFVMFAAALCSLPTALCLLLSACGADNATNAVA
jgi:hypothetical protein